jgi:hypothetical protein
MKIQEPEEACTSSTFKLNTQALLNSSTVDHIVFDTTPGHQLPPESLVWAQLVLTPSEMDPPETLPVPASSEIALGIKTTLMAQTQLVLTPLEMDQPETLPEPCEISLNIETPAPANQGTQAASGSNSESVDIVSWIYNSLGIDNLMVLMSVQPPNTDSVPGPP